MKRTQILSRSAEETERIAATVGGRLRGGEAFSLVSDLGGGKTTFTRGLVAGAGSTDHVASPTFTISRQYRAAKLTVFHYDFYRLAEPGIMAAELADSLEDPHGVVVVEWPEIVHAVLPPHTVTLRIAPHPDGRQLEFEAEDASTYLLEGLAG